MSVDDPISLSSDTDNIREALQQLEIPPEFSNADEDSLAADAIIRLEEWRRKAFGVLSDLRTRLKAREQYTLQEQADVVAAIAPFDGHGRWVTDSTRELAQECLTAYDDPGIPLLEQILGQKIKPIFRANTHPDVNVATGRKLPRPAGGTAGYQDHLEGQLWKEHPGITDVLGWCIQRIHGTMYEKLWHLVIPPLMTLLDDYEVSYKLRGSQVVLLFLQRVPPDILRRTGIDGLLWMSLKKCFAFLDYPDSAALLRTAVPASITLTELATAPKSEQRFNQLCVLLGDSIIGTVWIHGMRRKDVMEASVDVLPPLFQALGIGCARYLKALIPQLVYPLIPAPENAATLALQTSSAKGLCAIIKECEPRMFNWKGTILNGVCRCWVTLIDTGADSTRHHELKDALKDVCRELAQACPSVKEEEFRRLLQTDEMIFRPLLEDRAGGR